MKIERQGTLTHRDTESHHPVYFEVPEHTRHLTVTFSYTPVELAPDLPINEISLSLYGPKGGRGARHNNRDLNIVVTETYASPGYLPGEPEPGRWCLVIDAHRILPGPEVAYALTIKASSLVTEKRRLETVQKAARADLTPTGPGWYRGDLHAHSHHSDAAWQVPDLVAFATAQKLDFVTLSDHNTVSGLAEFQTHRSAELLTLDAFELTTFHGHALALGVNRLLEWRVAPPSGPQRTMRDLAAAVEAAGGLFVIAHPMSLGSPWCSGCHWAYPEMMPGTARALEVWNSSWDSTRFNEQALQLFYLWLGQGHRLVATAGTDSHRPPEAGSKLGFNVVYAENLSAEALLAAIKRGHLYLSGGPSVDLNARNGAGEVFKMGDVVTGNGVRVSLRWRGCAPGETVRVIADGKVHETLNHSTEGEHTLTFAILPAWLTLEIRDAHNDLRALSNPLFFQETFS